MGEKQRRNDEKISDWVLHCSKGGHLSAQILDTAWAKTVQALAWESLYWPDDPHKAEAGGPKSSQWLGSQRTVPLGGEVPNLAMEPSLAGRDGHVA
jgi:hypothetical protein